MKKSIALLGTLALALALCAPALAAGVTEQSGNPAQTPAEISTDIAPSYTVTIPGNVEVQFDQTSTAFGAIVLDAAQIEPGYAVKVALAASGTLKNEADKTATIPYEIRDKAAGTAFAGAEYTEAGESTALTIEISRAAWNAARAGKYSDTVTFTVSYGKATP